MKFLLFIIIIIILIKLMDNTEHTMHLIPSALWGLTWRRDARFRSLLGVSSRRGALWLPTRGEERVGRRLSPSLRELLAF